MLSCCIMGNVGFYEYCASFTHTMKSQDISGPVVKFLNLSLVNAPTHFTNIKEKEHEREIHL